MRSSTHVIPQRMDGGNGGGSVFSAWRNDGCNARYRPTVLGDGHLFSRQNLLENRRQLVLEVVDADCTVRIDHAHVFRLVTGQNGVNSGHDCLRTNASRRDLQEESHSGDLVTAAAGLDERDGQARG